MQPVAAFLLGTHGFPLPGFAVTKVQGVRCANSYCIH
jgi:hypothetical protein